MGKEKYQKKIRELFEKSPVVSFTSLKKIVNSNDYTKQLVRNLILEGKIKKLAKGFYTSHEDPSLNVFCFIPSYLGLEDSLSQKNLWEQETVPVIITSKTVRPGLRKTSLGNILVKRINKKYLFGFEYKKAGEFYLPYSDAEKTFIDLIYFSKKIDPEVLKNIKKSVDKKKLDKYLKKYPEKFRSKFKSI
jgi:predicted transcriptional regulator of viral defense system